MYVHFHPKRSAFIECFAGKRETKKFFSVYHLCPRFRLCLEKLRPLTLFFLNYRALKHIYFHFAKENSQRKLQNRTTILLIAALSSMRAVGAVSDKTHRTRAHRTANIAMIELTNFWSEILDFRIRHEIEVPTQSMVFSKLLTLRK